MATKTVLTAPYLLEWNMFLLPLPDWPRYWKTALIKCKNLEYICGLYGIGSDRNVLIFCFVFASCNHGSAIIEYMKTQDDSLS